MNHSLSQTSAFSGLGTLSARDRGAVALLGLGQVACADWAGAATSMPSVAWGLLLTGAGTLVALHGRLDIVTRRLGVLAGCVLAWLMLVQLTGLIPELSIASTASWCNALLVLIATAVAVRSGFGLLLIAVLMAPPLLRSLWSAWSYGVIGVGAMDTFDPNIAADHIVVASALVVAFLVPAPGAAPPPRQMPSPGLFTAVVLGSCLLLVGFLLSARVAVLLLVGVAGALCWPAKRWHWRLAPLWVLIAFVLLQLAMDAGLAAWLGLRGVGETSLTGVAAAQSSQLQDRLGMIVSSLQLFAAHPVTGTGLQTFGFLFSATRDATFNDGLAGTLVHNDWVQLLQESGLPLVLLLLTAALACLRAWFRAAGHLAAGEAGPAVRLRLGAAVGAAVILLHALTNFPLYDPATLALLAALIAAALLAGRELGEVREAPLSRGASVFGILLALPALWLLSRLLIYSTGMVVMGAAAPLPWTKPLQILPADQFRLADRLRSVAPEWSGAHYIQAESAAALLRIADETGSARNAGLIEFAANAYREAIGINPYLAEYSIQFARMLRETGTGDLDARLEILSAAQEKDRVEVRLWLARAFHLLEGGRPDEARAVIAQWLPLCAHSGRRNWRDTRALLGLMDQIGPGAYAAQLQDCWVRVEALGPPPGS